MADQVTGLSSIEDLEFEKLLQERIAAKRSRQVDEHSESLLLWLALAPAWPRAYIEAGFPTARGFAVGAAAVEAVDRAVDAGLAYSGTNDAEPATPIYWMTQAQTDSVLSFFLDQPHGAGRILTEFTQAAKAVRKASTHLPLPDDLARWCRLGEAGPRSYEMSRLFDREVDAAIARAESAHDTACPDARRWIETATPIATLFPGPLRVSLMRANRRFELFHRRAADKRHLANFLPRQSQIDDFHQLMQKPKGPWALHYVGSGGAGKTMLIRHITADLAPQLGLATARIDFDHLNPDYPTREPALLLAALAEELRLYERTSHSGFDYFYSAVNTLHESVDASGGTGGGDGAMQRIRPALTAFVDAIRKLEMRPLFILDTCEELAKLRPDGQIPDNVRVTFDILEELHRALPELRVVFSGRRPLACEGAGWRSRDVLLPKRDYLRLHVVRGFTRDEALAFLQSFRERERRLDPSMFEDILMRSPATDVTFAQRFEVDDRALLEGERYNPYDLAMFASLAAAGQLTSGVGAHFYVKERIVDRLPSSLVMLVPALVKVGTFDRGLIDVLCLRLNVEQRPTLADELAQQHWIGRVTTAAAADPMWTCDSIHRKRLLAYYCEEESETMVDTDRALLAILPELTIDRPWRNLSIAYFDATLQLLQRDVPRALAWWQRVEEKIAAHAEWDWAQRMTAQLLASEDGSWEEAAEKVPDALLRASILATHAAAWARLRRSEDDSLWRAVLQTAEALGGEAGALRRRAVAGIVNAAQWSSETPVVVCERILQHLDEPFVASDDERLLVIEVALLEGAVEVLERVPTELLTEPESWPSLLLEELYARHVFISEWSTMARVWASLRGRMEVLQCNVDDAEISFSRSLNGLSSAPMAKFLDWTPPDDLAARLKLEAVRGLALRFDVRKMLVSDECDPGDSLDSDRLASAALIVRTASAFKVIRPPISPVRKSRPAHCNAHRVIPSYLSTEIELQAAAGHVYEAIVLCRQAMTAAEVNADVLMQNELARLEGRLICRFRLFERGYSLSSLISTSSEPDDQWLKLRYAALTGLEERPAIARRALYGTDLTSVKEHRNKTDRLSFQEIWCRVGDGSVKLADAIQWVLSPQHPSTEALRIACRISARQSLTELRDRIGGRRAAEILLEEVEFAAASDELLNPFAFEKAADWFMDAGEPLGVLRARVLSVLGGIPSATAAQTVPTIVGSIPPDFVLGPDEVMSIVHSPRRVDQTLARLKETESALQPWAVRTTAAVLRIARSDSALLHLSRWTREHVPLIGTDLIAMIDVREEPPRASAIDVPQTIAIGLTPVIITGIVWLIAKGLMLMPEGSFGWLAAMLVLAFIILTANKASRGGTLAVVTIGGVWWGLYAIANEIPGATIFGQPWSFLSLLSFDLIVGGAVYGLSQTSKVLDWLKRLRVHLGRRMLLSVPTGPMKLLSWLGSLTVAVSQRGVASIDPALQYVLLRNQLTDDVALTLDRWLRSPWRQPVITAIHIDKPSSAGICWEAMLDPALFGDDDQQTRLFAAYRTLPTLPMYHADRPAVVRIASVYPVAEYWLKVLRRATRFAYAKTDDHSQITHIVGQPVEVREGIRLELGDDTLQKRTELLRPDFVRTRSKLVFCIVQGRPNDATVRTPTDRVIAAQLRQFGAEVFSAGVPLVLVIPPLPSPVVYDVAALIAYAVVEEQLTSTERVLAFVHRIRRIILRSASQTAGIEQAYDVCLYLDHVPALRPRRRFGLFALTQPSPVDKE